MTTNGELFISLSAKFSDGPTATQLPEDATTRDSGFRGISSEDGLSYFGRPAQQRTGVAWMDVKDLRYFIAVYETKGFSRASFQLGTVQSNVSARIRGLEKFLGVELFERHPFGIVPTRKGEALYVQAKPLLASIQQAEQSIRLATP